MSHFKLYVILTVHSLHHLQTADVHDVLCTAEVSSLSSILTVPKSSTISKFTNYRYIASNQTKDSLISLRSQNRMAQREIVSLKATIEEKKARIVHLEKMIEHDDRSVTVNPNTHQDLFSIM